MSGGVGLGAWLATLGAPQLRALLLARPDVARPPQPRTIPELAGRLSAQHSLLDAAAQVSRPALQVAEALLALGGSAEPAELLQILGITDEPTAGQVDRALDELRALAIVWPSGSRLRLTGGWTALVPDPLALGRPGAELYGQLTTAQLGRIGSAHGIGGQQGKQRWVRAINGVVADPATIEHRLERAAPKLAEDVRRIAWHGPRISGVRFPHAAERVAPDDVGVQLALQGWVVPTQWSGVGEMPREVALAVRGPGYHAPFATAPPRPATSAVDPGRLDAAGRRAATDAVAAVRRLVALLDRAPLTTLQAGGVGVRELRRAAKQLSTDEPSVRLWLETAAGAGLVVPTAEAVLATTDVDGWLAVDPAEALSALLFAWWGLPLVPGHRLDDTGKPAPAMVRPYGGGEHARLRAQVIGELAGLGAGRALVDPDGLAAVLAHHRPLANGSPDVEQRLRTTLAEATLLGLVADGALTPMGFDLIAASRADDPVAAFAAAVAGALPPATRTATFLPDLTVIVAGAAAPELARLLDDVADAESRDTASTWRFTPASVRRAFDSGRGPDELLTALAAVADKPLPQPLEYLVRDVARRHGQLQVFAVASCVRVADAALGAEVAAHRGLAPLRLRALSDTVLASAKPIGETIGALRKAGYAPVRLDSRGESVAELAPVRRAEVSRSRATRPPIPTSPDVALLADRLSGALVAPTRGGREQRDDPLTGDEVPLLDPTGIAVLAHAIARRFPVLIDYLETSGTLSVSVVEPRMKLFGTLVAWCRKRQADRNFDLDRILAASPVDP